MSAVKPRPIPPLGHRGRVPTLVKLPPPRRWGHNRLRCSPHHLQHHLQQLEHRLVHFARSAHGSNGCERGAQLVATDGDIYFVSHCTYKYSVYVSWGHWRVPETDVDLPSDFSTLPIDPPPLSPRNGGYMEDLKSRD
ncbi:hypothetical protein DM02DRAFT_657141 [Periconia macrospinosa]|uniref:Uncharacterized protein n=1 Tax=Periconia macrospinosa TaxID=97972 RepID=A0A2V1DMY7_9PLEO|nr:hypothetical protein DM02DRAFT_657141 [Periconia macrospinosa]